MDIGIDIERKLGGLGRPVKFPAGAMLFRAGEKASAFFRLETGTVKVLRTAESGRELEVARLGPGDFLGEAFALAGWEYSFSAEAASEAAVRRFEIPKVRKAIASDPEIALFFVDLLARKCVLLSRRVESLGLQTVRQRLAQYLLRSCEGAPAGRCTVGLSITKSELARHLGTVGETLSRSMKALSEAGMIEVRGREIKILNCPALRAEIGDF